MVLKALARVSQGIYHLRYKIAFITVDIVPPGCPMKEFPGRSPEAPVRIVNATMTSMVSTSVNAINLQEPSLNLEP